MRNTFLQAAVREVYLALGEGRLFAVMWRWQRTEAEEGSGSQPGLWPALHQGPTTTSGPSSCGPEGCIEGGGREERRAEGEGNPPTSELLRVRKWRSWRAKYYLGPTTVHNFHAGQTFIQTSKSKVSLSQPSLISEHLSLHT